MNNLLTLSYWLNSRPPGLSPFGTKLFAIFVTLLAILAFIFYLVKARKKNHYTRIFEKIYFLFVSNFVVGLFLLFFAIQLIPFLSTRILLLFWLLTMIVWLVFIARSCAEIPKIKKKKAEEKEYKKYIP